MSTARDDLTEHFASVMYENDNSPADWHHAKPEDRDEYLRIAATKVDAYRAEVLREDLNPAERTMLRFALELTEEQMMSRGDEFTDDDEAAMGSLKRLAGEESQS